jgi:putative transposase
MLYLVVIMDWVSRAVLAWRLANTLGADFCVEALEDALEQYGKPEIFNTDQAASYQHRLHRRPRARRRHDQHGW